MKFKVSRRKFLSGAGMAATAAMFGLQGTRPATAGTLDDIKASGKLRIGFFQAPPLSFMNEAGQIDGYSPNLVKRIAEKNGIKTIEPTVLEFEGLIPGLIGKRFDLIACDMQIKPQRCKVVAFSRPTSLISTGLAARKGNPLNVRSFADIAANPKVRLGGVAATFELNQARAEGVPDGQITEFPNDDSLVQGLFAGRVDVVTDVVPILIGLMQKKSGDFELVEDFVGPMANGKPVVNACGLVFRKEDTDLLDFFNRAITEEFASGEQQASLKHFGLPDSGIPTAGMTAEEFCSA